MFLFFRLRSSLPFSVQPPSLQPSLPRPAGVRGTDRLYSALSGDREWATSRAASLQYLTQTLMIEILWSSWRGDEYLNEGDKEWLWSDSRLSPLSTAATPHQRIRSCQSEANVKVNQRRYVKQRRLQAIGYYTKPSHLYISHITDMQNRGSVMKGIWRSFYFSYSFSNFLLCGAVWCWRCLRRRSI